MMRCGCGCGASSRPPQPVQVSVEDQPAQVTRTCRPVRPSDHGHAAAAAADSTGKNDPVSPADRGHRAQRRGDSNTEAQTRRLTPSPGRCRRRNLTLPGSESTGQLELGVDPEHELRALAGSGAGERETNSRVRRSQQGRLTICQAESRPPAFIEFELARLPSARRSVRVSLERRDPPAAAQRLSH